MSKPTRRASLALLAALTACGARQPVPTPDVASAPVAEAARPAPVSPALRLPTQVRPSGYTAELTLDPAAPTFQGVVDIDLDVKEATDVLWLHGRSLTVKEATLTVGGRPVALTQTKGNGDFLGFVPEATLQPGTARLRLAYEGQLSEREVSGAFRAREGGDWYVFTQFEPLGARRVFPCFDEPGFKVPWQLTLHVPRGNVAVTNTPLVAEEPGANGTTYRFARTQPLPSYLIALGVGPFDFLEAKPSGEKGVRTRIITPRGPRRRGRLCRPGDAGDSRPPGEVLRHRLPVREAGRAGRAALRGGHGAPGPGHVQLGAPPVQARRGHPPPAARLLQRADARAGAPVVRQPRHPGVVGRRVAQRGLRHLDDAAHRRGRAALVGRPHRARAGPLVRAVHRQPGVRAPHPPAHRVRGRRLQRLRRHHLRQGLGGAGHGRELAGPRRLPARRAALPARPRPRQRHREGLPRRPLGRGGPGRVRRAGHLPGPGRRAGGLRCDWTARARCPR